MASSVVPAKAGTHPEPTMDSRLRGNDEFISTALLTDPSPFLSYQLKFTRPYTNRPLKPNGENEEYGVK